MSDVIEQITAALNESADALREARAGLVLDRVFPEDQCDHEFDWRKKRSDWAAFVQWSRVFSLPDEWDLDVEEPTICLPFYAGPVSWDPSRWDEEAVALEIYQPVPGLTLEPWQLNVVRWVLSP